MKPSFSLLWFNTPTGHLVLVIVLVLVAAGAVAWRKTQRGTVPAVTRTERSAPSMPRVFTRETARFVPPVESPKVTPAKVDEALASAKSAPAPLCLVAGKPTVAETTLLPRGSLLSCETVLAVHSQGEAPVIARLTEDVWIGGRKVLGEGTVLHGRAIVDPATARITARGEWHFVAENGETTVEALALARSDSAEEDGVAGLAGVVVDRRPGREARIFSAAFLGSAGAELQNVRTTASDVALPSASARNAALAGTSAVLREYIQDLRERNARDGVQVRLPAGTPFHLYLTRSLTLSHAN